MIFFTLAVLLMSIVFIYKNSCLLGNHQFINHRNKIVCRKCGAILDYRRIKND